MIRPGEIQTKAREVGVRDQQIEKDYTISWILQGIAQHEQLSNSIVFKGGTVLKKVYFEDYRFSEDLDFTLLDNDISNEQIFDWYTEVFEYVSFMEFIAKNQAVQYIKWDESKKKFKS